MCQNPRHTQIKYRAKKKKRIKSSLFICLGRIFINKVALDVYHFMSCQSTISYSISFIIQKSQHNRIEILLQRKSETKLNVEKERAANEQQMTDSC